MATIHGKSGSKLKGEVTLSDKGGKGVKLHVEVEGAKPGTHGIHIHEYADCSAADGSSAGGHFNPEGHEHGLPEKEMRHLGDLGNIVIGQDGKGTLDIVVADANLKDIDPHSFIGRGLIIHEKKDNGGQPVGNAGGRVGCAEIK
jgi:Cu-Zn family superoxide dismutase